MLRKLFRKLIREELKKAYDAGYDDGITKGYELGWMMGKIERTNRGFIIGNKLDQEIEEILKEHGGMK